MFSFALGVGYDFGRQTETPIAAFLRYQWFGLAPGMPDLPVIPQALVHVGVRFDLGGA